MKPTQVNINHIMSIIPHRYPFLLVDKVLFVDPGKSATGVKNVTANEPQFTGHFPENPVMPGVLIVEAMAQLAAVLVAKSMGNPKGKEVFFMSIDECKFRKLVRPGDSLMMHVSITQSRGDVWKFKAHSEIEGGLAAESRFTAMVKDKAKE